MVALLAVGIFALQGCDFGGTDSGASMPATTEEQAATNQALGTIATVAPGQSRYFDATHQTVAQPFLDYWEKNGGLAVFGYPITHRIKEKDRATGEEYTAQYFERARFELHSATGDKVILGRLGAILHAPEPPAVAKSGSIYFKETGHNVSGAFFDFWNAHGGLALFGYPTTEVLTEHSAADGKDYQVQYFERARFESHPEFAGTPNEVQLGQLGKEAYRAKSLPQ